MIGGNTPEHSFASEFTLAFCSSSAAARAAAILGTNVFTFADRAAEVGLEKLGARDPGDAEGVVCSRPGKAAYLACGPDEEAGLAVRAGVDLSPDGIVLDKIGRLSGMRQRC